MKIQDRLAEVTSSGQMNEVFFGLSQEGFAIVLDILRNQLYSNKELAVVRELSCNAYDAHVEAGKKDVPFTVQLPTDLEPTFKVRDYGHGLNDQEVREVFVMYGASTKRWSDDFIGQKGIGAKCPFAYGDSFMVVSYQQSIKRTYTAYLDPSMIGKMAMLSEEETTEPDGLEVIVSVREDDITKFKNEAYSLFKYWKLRPKFEGAEIHFPDENNLFAAKDGSWVIPAKTEGSYRFETPVAIMGNVAYALDDDSLDWTGQDQGLRTLFNVGIRMWLPIGAIEVNASREALQYTTQTQQAIFDKLVEIRDELVESVNNQLKSCKRMFDAKVLFSKVFDLASPLYVLKDMFEETVTFNGKIVTSDHWDGQNDRTMGAVVKRYVKASGRRSRAYCGDTVCRVIATEQAPIILNDLGTDKGILGRIAPLVEKADNEWGSQCDSVQVISVKDAETWAKWKEEKAFDAPMWKLSSFPKLKMKDIYPMGAAGNGYHNVKHLAKVFEFDDSNAPSYRRGRKEKSVYWEPLDIDYDNDEGVYVVLNKFEFSYNSRGYSYHSPRDLSTISSQVEAAGIDWPDPIIGIKKSRIEKGLPPKMVSLDDYLKKAIAEKLQAANLEQVMVNKQAIAVFRAQHNSSEALIDNLSKLADLSPFIANFVNHYKEMDAKVDQTAQASALESLARNFNVTVDLKGCKAPYELNEDFGAIKKIYPMIFTVELERYSYHWDRLAPHVKRYISLVNASISKDNYPEVEISDGAGI